MKWLWFWVYLGCVLAITAYAVVNISSALDGRPRSFVTPDMPPADHGGERA